MRIQRSAHRDGTTDTAMSVAASLSAGTMACAALSIGVLTDLTTTKGHIMAPKILIVGATGTNGRALVQLCQARGIPVRALVRASAGEAPALGPGVDVVKGDLADRDSLAAALSEIEKVFAVTAIHPDVVSWFDTLFDAADAAQVRHLVKFSGLGAGADSPCEIIRQHGQSDERLMRSGLPYTILRPNSFYQNMLGQAQLISSEGRFYLPLGDAAQSMIDVRDIAEIAAKILTEDGHIGEIYELTGPEALSFHDVARILGDVRGETVSYQPITVADAEASYLRLGMPAWTAHALADLQGVFATGAYAEPLPTSERLLGRAPKSFYRFAEDYADRWRSDAGASQR